MIEIKEKLEDETRLFGWKSNLPLTPFAPNYAHYFTEKKIFSEVQCKEWYKYLLEQEIILLDKFKKSAGDGRTGLGDNSITSRHPFFNLLKFDFHLVPKLKTEILNGIRTLLRISGNTDWHKILDATCWFNVMRQGEAMDTHFHGYHMNSFYGFHLTIGAKETFTSYYHPVTYPHDEEGAFHVPNRQGYLTLFPDFIPHGVSTNKHVEPRITIAGDIHPQSWFDKDIIDMFIKDFKGEDFIIDKSKVNYTQKKLTIPNFVEIGIS